MHWLLARHDLAARLWEAIAREDAHCILLAEKLRRNAKLPEDKTITHQASRNLRASQAELLLWLNSLNLYALRSPAPDGDHWDVWVDLIELARQWLSVSIASDERAAYKLRVLIRLMELRDYLMLRDGGTPPLTY
jgi:hypothetical protein